MNGTRTLRVAGTLALVVALAAPGSALAKKKTTHHKPKATATPTIVVPHDYDAGGNGGSTFVAEPGVRINLFDPVQVAVGLGNQALGQLGLPPVALPGV